MDIAIQKPSVIILIELLQCFTSPIEIEKDRILIEIQDCTHVFDMPLRNNLH